MIYGNPGQPVAVVEADESFSFVCDVNDVLEQGCGYKLVAVAIYGPQYRAVLVREDCLTHYQGQDSSPSSTNSHL